MALKDTMKHLKDLLSAITHDLDKADGGNKAASQRVRTGTVKLEKIAKHYRKESIKSEKQTKGTRKPAKKAAHKVTAKKTTHKVAHKAGHKVAHKTTHKATIKVKAKPKARPRALAFKKPSAKLPVRKSHR